MSQPGGPAALNGFLYQMLHHLHWMAEVRLAGALNGRRVTNATLVLEPSDGGDGVGEARETYLVEQYKTRHARTWSLAHLMPALADLRKAVPPSLPQNASYRFVTDGRSGRLAAFESFLRAARSAYTPHDLDNLTKREFRKGLAVTDREFLAHVDAATRPRSLSDGGAPAAADHLAATLHFLSRFEMVFGVTADATAGALDDLLSCIAPPTLPAANARRQLVGALLERLAKGQLCLDAEAVDALLREADLSPSRLRDLPRIAETLHSLARERLSGRYDARLDVRLEPPWPESKPVLLVAGASGSGKSWQLASLLAAASRRHRAATLIQSATTAPDALTQAARDYWQHGLGETTEMSLDALSNWLRRIDPEAPQPRFTIAVDDVADIDVARQLVRQSWNHLDMRLVMAVSDEMADSLLLSDARVVDDLRVGDFTPNQLDELLRREGLDAGDLAPDLRLLLRKPILAGVFLRLRPSPNTDAPDTEYQVFDSFWRRIAINAKHADFGSVLSLADKICDAQVHPLPRRTAIDAGVSETTLERLVTSGWIAMGATGEIGFSHDRLLNWAMAKSLARRFKSGEITSDKLADILVGADGDGTRFDRRRLAYVPMDVLWQLAADPLSAKGLAPIVFRFEQEAPDHGQAIYAEVLPALGQRAIPILLRRLDDIVAVSPHDFRVRHIAQGFAALARQAAVDLEPQLGPLLRSRSRDKQNVALAALAAVPVPHLLDHVWRLHRDRTALLRDDTHPFRHADYEASFSAMRAAVALDPTWLSERIGASASDARSAPDLAYLLCAMDHADAPGIWANLGHVLMENVPREKPRSLIQCIARFRDRGRRDFVIGNLPNRRDFAAGASLAGLAVLDPEAALEHLEDVDAADRYLSRNQWLPILLRANPNLTRQRILELAQADGDSTQIVNLFWERAHEIDEPLLLAVLRDLERQCRELLDEGVAAEVNRAGRSLEFLARVSNPHLLHVFEREAGGKLERLIVTLASGRLQSNSRIRDHIRDAAHVVLTFMGGQGDVMLLARELDSEHYWVRYSGLTWGARHARAQRIRRRLLGLAARTANVADGLSDDRLEPMLAIRLLAAGGADAAMVRAIEVIGPSGIPRDLPRLRPRSTRISRRQTAHARHVLGTTNPQEHDLLLALIVASVSNDTDFVPTVLSVLRNADADGRVARFACIALNALGDDSDAFAEVADRLLRSSSNSSLGFHSLARMGERGQDIVADWLADLGSSAHDGETVAKAIRVLHSHPRAKLRAVEAAVEHYGRAGPFDDALFDIVAESPDCEIRERVHDAAFDVESISPSRSLLAIEGLAKFDMGGAIAACKRFLRSYPRSAAPLCHLLTRIARSEALHVLMEAATATKEERVRNAIGRSLRRLEPERVSTELVDRLAGPMPDRLKAAQLAAWVPLPTVQSALAHSASVDGVPEVRAAAGAALEAHDREAHVLGLLAAFPSAPRDRQWSLLLALLHVGDAHLLSDPDDPLWLGHVLSSDSLAPMRHHAEQALRRRRDKEP